MTDKARAKRIFLESLDLSADERAAFLDRECGADAELRAEVDALFDAARDAGSFLEHPAGPVESDHLHLASTDMAAGEADRLVGTRIGPYKLLELIGEGGFGAVYVAEQEKPVRRRVALKLIKLGMDTRQVIARFEAERQALAMMDHPNIARVLDAGATDTGRPFFVMEYVKGDPITTFADAHKLSVKDRLDLFTQVCQAVQHAHTKGIIHRDLKPGNVIAFMSDGRPFAKVIDFDIAKATGASLTDMTVYTGHHQLIGTPVYMSPEQAEGSPDIDTRSDVYSLGVVLYELLTGATPFDAKRLRSAAYGEMQRIIKEEEPPAPSVRLSRSMDSLAATAASRQTEPARLGVMLRGDLDWISMKCLEKDRQRRYATANEVAADVQRHLSGEPVVAAPPSVGYRVRKFVRKHRGQAAAAGLIAVVLIAATGTSLFFAGREAQAKRLMEEQRDSARAEREKTQRLFQQAKRGLVRLADALGDEGQVPISTPVAEFLKQYEPSEGDPIELRETLKRARGMVEDNLSNLGFKSGDLLDVMTDIEEVLPEGTHIDAEKAIEKLVEHGLWAIQESEEQRRATEAANAELEAQRLQLTRQRDAAQAARRKSDRLGAELALETRIKDDGESEEPKNDKDAVLAYMGSAVQGTCFFRLNRFDEAATALKKALSISSKFSNISGGMTWWNTDDDFCRALDLRKPEILRLLAISTAVLGKSDEATQVLKQAVEAEELSQEILPFDPIIDFAPTREWKQQTRELVLTLAFAPRTERWLKRLSSGESPARVKSELDDVRDVDDTTRHIVLNAIDIALEKREREAHQQSLESFNSMLGLLSILADMLPDDSSDTPDGSSPTTQPSPKSPASQPAAKQPTEIATSAPAGQ